jgi:hypothetical protein
MRGQDAIGTTLHLLVSWLTDRLKRRVSLWPAALDQDCACAETDAVSVETTASGVRTNPKEFLTMSSPCPSSSAGRYFRISDFFPVLEF